MLPRWLYFLSVMAVAGLPGCAVMKATQQPEKKDLGILSPGTPRTHVIAELGAPSYSEERDGEVTDVFAFKQGYTKVTKAGRALVHGAADVATFGLWEVVGVPAESLMDGSDVKVAVTYNPDRTVAAVDYIRGQELAERSKTRWFARIRRKTDEAETASSSDVMQR